MIRRLAAIILACACTAVLAAPTNTVNPQPPGRLFFTPAERTALDEGRSLAPTEDAASPAPPVASNIQFDGLLRRPGRPPLIWVNGQPLTGPMIQQLNITGLNGQTLILQTDNKIVRLKPGQHYDRASGRVKEFGLGR